MTFWIHLCFKFDSGIKLSVSDSVLEKSWVILLFLLKNSLLVFPRGSMRRRWWHSTPVLLPGKSHGWRSLVGCSPWGLEELERTERLHFHFSLSCIGEGNGSPLRCSCLENPRTGEPGGLPSMGLHRVGHDWSDLAAAVVSLELKGTPKPFQLIKRNSF